MSQAMSKVIGQSSLNHNPLLVSSAPQGAPLANGYCLANPENFSLKKQPQLFPKIVQESKKEREEEERAYKEAFDYYDWNKSGTIPTGVSF